MNDKLSKHKITLAMTSIIILLPIIIGLLVYHKLPDSMAVHFGVENEANGWAPKSFVVFGIPVLLLALHWFVIIYSFNDPKRKNINNHFQSFNFWIIPITTLFLFGAVYTNALHYEIDTGFWSLTLLAGVFLYIGNYLPKTKQNYTFGIKIPWTLHDEDNWNKTHRLAGWCFVISGLLFLVSIFVDFIVPMLIVILILCTGIPICFSFLYYRKKL